MGFRVQGCEFQSSGVKDSGFSNFKFRVSGFGVRDCLEPSSTGLTLMRVFVLRGEANSGLRFGVSCILRVGV